MTVFKNRVPPFCGLRKLELYGMGHEHAGRVHEIEEILVSCPDMIDLSLSLSMADSAVHDCNDLLPKLIQRYSSTPEKRLRLQSLRLGYGFLPIQSSPEYMSELTDLTILKTLRLDNDNVGVSTGVMDAPIDAKLFASAASVTSFSAERLSPDVVELIDLLNSAGKLVDLSLPRFCDTQPRARMDKNNEFWGPERYNEELIDLPQWGPTQLFSQPLEQAGRH
jgi:hypothetical protein